MWPKQLDIAKRAVFIFPDFTYDAEAVVGNSWMFHLHHKTIEGASVRVETNVEGKLTFSPSWPSFKGTTYSDKAVGDATVTSNRKNEDIAKDVERRVLTPYYAALPAQLQLMKEAQERLEKQHEVIGEFYDLLERKRPERLEGDTYNPYNFEVRTLQFSYDGQSVRIETHHIPVGVAKEICELLKKRVPKK